MFKKIISAALVFATVLAFSCAGFAEEYKHEDAKIEITNSTDCNKYAIGSKIEYTITVNDTERPETVTVNGENIDVKNFNFSGESYVYSGDTVLPATGSVVFEVSDKDAKTAVYKKTMNFDLDTINPIVNAKTVTAKKTYAMVMFTVSDDVALKSIKINDKTAKEVYGQKSSSFYYFLLKEGLYIITVEDEAGNQTVSYVEYEDGKLEYMFDIYVPKISGNEITTEQARTLYELIKENGDTDKAILYWYLSMSASSNVKTQDNSGVLYMILLQSLNDDEDSYKTSDVPLLQLLSSQNKDINKYLQIMQIFGNEEIKDNSLFYKYCLTQLVSENESGADISMLLYLMNSSDDCNTDELLRKYYLNSLITQSDDMDNATLIQLLSLMDSNEEYADLIYRYYLSTSTSKDTDISVLLQTMILLKDNDNKTTSPWMYQYYASLIGKNAQTTANTVKLAGYESDVIIAKKGEKIFLIPDNTTGVWVIDDEYVSLNSSNACTIATVIKEGFTTAVYYVVEDGTASVSTFYIYVV